MIDEKRLVRTCPLSGITRIFPTNATLENYGISNLIKKNSFYILFIMISISIHVFLSDFHCLVDQLQKEA